MLVPRVELTTQSWSRRHAALRTVLWLHLALVTLVAVLSHSAHDHPGLTWGFVAGAFLSAALGHLPQRQRSKAVLTSVGLLLCADALVHASGGQTDMHFDFFVVLALIGLYQDWVPFALAVCLVALHHGVVGVLMPHAVYSSPLAQAHPVRYAALHAGFVLAMCAAQVAYWRYTAAADDELRTARAHAELLALVAQNTDNAVVITDPAGVVTWVNDAYTRMTGYSRAEAVGRTRRSMLHVVPIGGAGQHEKDTTGDTDAGGPRADDALAGEVIRRAMAGEPVEVEVFARDGSRYWMDLEVRAIHAGLQTTPHEHAVERAPTHATSTTGLIGIERDVTARRRADEQAREASAHALVLAGELDAEKQVLSAVLSSLPHLVAWRDADGTLQGCNDIYARQVQAEAGSPISAGENRESALEAAIAAAERSVLASGRALRDQAVTVTGPIGDRVQYLLTVTPLDEDTSLSNTTTHPATEHPTSAVDGSRSGIVTVATDVTRVADLERQLSQAHRLESLGQLAAGIAHEINTPIQFISDNTRYVADTVTDLLAALASTRATSMPVGDTKAASLREADGPQDAPTLDEQDLDHLSREVPQALAESLEGLDRVARIVRAMKEFSHPGHGLADIDLNHAIEATIQISRNEWKHVSDVAFDPDPHLGFISGYEGELKQALLNLVVNAAHAIRERQQSAPGPGVIRITAHRRPTAPGGAPPRGTIAPGTVAACTVPSAAASEVVEIAVTDNGTGMTDDVCRRVFDPFFTTKPVGKGTGQGMTLVHHVITVKHAGTVTIRTAPGKGTTITVTLPTTGPGHDRRPATDLPCPPQ
ncbi:MAG: PAS domain S-box protein [Actinobacteria bacterium]|nr:PAS domain S-box protein [Actinomycetota bacterium]